VGEGFRAGRVEGAFAYFVIHTFSFRVDAYILLSAMASKPFSHPSVNGLEPLPALKEPARETQSRPTPPVAPSRSKKKKKLKRNFFLLFFIFILMMGTLVSVGVGMLNQFLEQMPSIPYLEDYRPWMPSQIFSGEGKHLLIADFFSPNQNREVAPLSEIPVNLRNAVVALEDVHFEKHCGISPRGILRAAVVNLKAGQIKQGGSTITMQLSEDLVKNHHLPYAVPEKGLKSFTEKIVEAFLSLQIEKRYTKDEILEIYLNQVFLGGNIFGVARAAESYFGKNVKDLNLKECALFAGMLQSPNRYAPVKNLDAAEKRTAVVLEVMLREGFITQKQYEEAISQPFQLNTTAARRTQLALYPYYSWAIHRQFAEKEILTRDHVPIDVYGQGVDVDSTIDTVLQPLAEESLRKGIVEHEHRRRPLGGRDRGTAGYRGVNLSGPGQLQVGVEYDAKVVTDYDPGKGIVEVTVPNVQGGQGTLPVPVIPNETWLDDFDLLHRGYYIRVKAVQEGREMKLRLAPERYVQGALIAVQPSTGKVLSLVGGYDFYDSQNGGQYNRAVQATTVQPGSAFKPLLYTTALADPSKKWTVLSTLQDVEREFWKGWTPQNFEGEFFGPVPMRFALAHSLNVASVWLLDNFKGSRMGGIQTVRNFCRNIFDLDIEDTNLSMALGTMGTSPWQLAQAYSVLADGGDFVRLHMVEKVSQRKSTQLEIPNVLYEFKQPYEQRKRLSPQVAYLTTYLMRGVIEEGTAIAAKDLPFYCVGKTGTTDSCAYAWFAGFTKDLLCVVYFGYDDYERSLGPKMTGSKVALPVWMDFMKKAYEIHPELFGEITPPEGINMVTICQASGQPATAKCPKTQKVPFMVGTEPGRTCPIHGEDRTQPYHDDINKIILSADSNTNSMTQ